MDQSTQEDTSLQTERDMSTPLPPKRPRIDHTLTNSENSTFDFSQVLTFGKTPLTNSSPKNADLLCTKEYEDIQGVNPPEKPQESELNGNALINRMTAHTDDTSTGLFEVFFTTAETHLNPYEQPSSIEMNKLSPCPVDDADGALAESHTSKDSSDMSTHPVSQRPGKHHEDKPPGGCSVPYSNGKDERQLQNKASQIQAVSISSIDEKVSCQSDYTYEDAPHDVASNTCSQSGWLDIIKCCKKIPFIEDDLGEKLPCLSVHALLADFLMIEGITQERKTEEVTRVEGEIKADNNCYAEISVNSEDELLYEEELKADMTDLSPDGCITSLTEGDKLLLGGEDEQGINLCCFSEYQDKNETFPEEIKDELLTLCFPVNDSHDLSLRSHSETADNNLAALNCNNKFSPLPSAFPLHNCAPGGFDKFEKIQLCPDEDDDACLGNSPLLTSLPRQLLITPQKQLQNSMPGEESDEIPEEEKEEEVQEEVERFEYHTDNMADGFPNNDANCNKLAEYIKAEDVFALEWPKQQPDYESAADSQPIQEDVKPQSMFSSGSPGSNWPAPVVTSSPTFEMKKQFDFVLKELKLFFDISRSEFACDSGQQSPEQRSDITVSEGNTSIFKEDLTIPELAHHGDTSSDADEDRSLEMCGGDQLVSCVAGSRDGEQEVPYGSHLCQEASMYTAEKPKELQETELSSIKWSPSFMCLPILEQQSRGLPGPTRRLEPMRTCTRPIRVGLSRRAKTKHLHRPHP